jgi:hypothetical protein
MALRTIQSLFVWMKILELALVIVYSTLLLPWSLNAISSFVLVIHHLRIAIKLWSNALKHDCIDCAFRLWFLMYLGSLSYPYIRCSSSDL